jgi:hypothetical protein
MAADVVIIAGQSNAGGKALFSDLATRQVDMLTCPSNVRLYEWDIPISYANRAAFGVEVPIIHKWAAVNPAGGGQELIVIKCWKGGTNIWQWLPHPDPTRNYPRMIAAIRSALAGITVRRISFVWVQGEDDTWMEKSLAKKYLSDLMLLIGSIRSDIGFSSMPVAVVVLSHPFRSTAPWLYLVTQAQIDISSLLPNVASVSSLGCSKYSDQIHYNARGIIALGKRIYSYIK